MKFKTLIIKNRANVNHYIRLNVIHIKLPLLSKPFSGCFYCAAFFKIKYILFVIILYKGTYIMNTQTLNNGTFVLDMQLLNEA